MDELADVHTGENAVEWDLIQPPSGLAIKMEMVTQGRPRGGQPWASMIQSFQDFKGGLRF
jgi:hypothetical protein